MKRLLGILCGLLLGANAGMAQELTMVKIAKGKNAWVPDSAITQHAAYAGYMAAGFGYEWIDRLAVDLLYGYTPPEVAGETVHSWTMKSMAYLFSVGSRDTARVRPYLGLSVYYSPDPGLFVHLPDQYPKGYYLPSAIRYGLLGGLEVRVQNRLAVGVEFAVLDSELSYLNDSKSFDPNRMGSSGLSLRWLL